MQYMKAEIGGGCCCQAPMETVPAPWIVQVGAGAGSLQVCTLSPTRAAGLLLISTELLPISTVP